MPDVIQLLPDHIANQIAAGEVIQRPASVVKELMENSLDAGSRTIHLVVKDAGKTLLQVIDDGHGMSADDARICFERHATSKIRVIDDLFALRTMGFRGEAMASIAAVAHVELKTKREGDELGTRLVVEGSRRTVDELCQQAKGTSISVRNLFFNVPARRNFLKSDAVETRHIIDEFLHIALAHPDVAFTLHHNGSEIYHLQASNLRQRIVAVFGHKYNEKLVPVAEDTDYVKVNGFIGKPADARRSRGEQYFFLNGRYIRNSYLNHAVLSAYGNLLNDKTYPLYILHIEIDPKAVDINVHPTKQEVKFEDERSIYMIVQAAVKHGLAQYNVTPSIDFEQEASFKDFEAFRSVFSESGTAAKSGSEPAPRGKFQRESAEAWQKLYEQRDLPGNGGTVITVPSGGNEPQELPLQHRESDTAFQPVQLHRTFILTQIKSGIVILHQHLAHQRILYERYLRSFKLRTACQQLLFPEKLEFTAGESTLLRQILSDIRLLGFDIAGETSNAFIVRGVPADLADESPKQIFEQMLEQFQWNARHDTLDQRENIARSLARHTAIPAGKILTGETMSALIDQLFGCQEPRTTAYGQPTYLLYNLDFLREQFREDAG